MTYVGSWTESPPTQESFDHTPAATPSDTETEHRESPYAGQAESLFNDTVLAIAALASERTSEGPGRGFRVNRQGISELVPGDQYETAKTEIDLLTRNNPYGREFGRAVELRAGNMETRTQIIAQAAELIGTEGPVKAREKIQEMLLLESGNGGVGTNDLPR